MANCIFCADIVCDRAQHGCCCGDVDSRPPLYTREDNLAGLDRYERLARYVECIFNRRTDRYQPMDNNAYLADERCNSFPERENCSGFVAECVNWVMGLNLDGSALLQINAGGLMLHRMTLHSTPKRGSILFFHAPGTNTHQHVVFFLGNGYIGGMNHGNMNDGWKRKNGIFNLSDMFTMKNFILSGHTASYPGESYLREIYYCDDYAG